MRLSSLLVIFFALIAASASRASDRVIYGGEVTTTVDTNARPVRIEAGAAELRNLARRAFNAHGAFRVDDGASTTLRFDVVGPSTVRVTIQSRSGGGFTQEASGTTLRHALLRAADAAVTHLTGLPGFFSGKLTFVSERTGASEIYTADLFFGEVLQLTSDRSQCVTPRWSPDGRYILYTGYFKSGFPDIYRIDTATRQRIALVSLKGTNTGGRYSPDGSQIAMVLSGSGNPEVYVSNSQGRQIRRITHTERQIEATPAWSPRGDRLVVASDRRATGKPQLFLLSLGGAMQALPTNISGYCAEPDWDHARGDEIAFTAASGRGYQVAVYSLSQRRSRWVTRQGGDAIEPCWVGDGRHLLFTARSAGSERIYLLDTQSGRATPLSPTGLGKTYQANFVMR